MVGAADGAVGIHIAQQRAKVDHGGSEGFAGGIGDVGNGEGDGLDGAGASAVAGAGVGAGKARAAGAGAVDAGAGSASIRIEPAISGGTGHPCARIHTTQTDRRARIASGHPSTVETFGRITHCLGRASKLPRSARC